MLSTVQDDQTINSIAFSPSDSHFASGSANGTVKLWDMIGDYSEDPDYIKGPQHLCLAISEDGTLIAAESYDHDIQIWTAETATTLCYLKGHNQSIEALVFSPNTKLIASGSSDTTVRLWDVERQSLRMVFSGQEKKVQAVAFSPDSTVLAYGSTSRTLQFWHIPSGEGKAVCHGDQWYIKTVVFSPDGRLAATGHQPGNVRL